MKTAFIILFALTLSQPIIAGGITVSGIDKIECTKALIKNLMEEHHYSAEEEEIKVKKKKFFGIFQGSYKFVTTGEEEYSGVITPYFVVNNINNTISCDLIAENCTGSSVFKLFIPDREQSQIIKHQAEENNDLCPSI